ncbi:MAG TPA: glycosyltransferase [Trebonia sp.]|nr:glycosyltransferase [Trebonia sp.]
MSTKSANAPQPRAAVTAIIVAHDGARILPALVKGLQSQTHPVDQTIAVDTASQDRSGAVLAELIGQDAVLGMSAATGFGEAVAAALGHATRRRSGATDPSLARAEWIWLLHDDCEPAPDALERLVRAAGRDPAVAVVGPKLLDAQDRRTLREAGVSIDRAGRRVTGIDPGEIDQGQHDHKRAVLAVSSAGMLVRREVWERLGGFDPNLKLMRDDVDFCWRVQAAGFRVHVATDAIVYHWELAGRRRRDAQGGSVRVADRRNALYVLAVNLPLLAMFRIVGGCVAGALARACYFLLTKQLDLSAAYALSALGLFAHPVRLFKARHRRARRLAEGYYAVRAFIPPAHTLAKVAEEIAGIVSSGPPQASSGRHQATVEESEQDAQFVDQVSPVRRIIAHPGVQLFIALLLISLVATRRLLGTSPLGGGALVPAWGGAPALWHEYLAGFHAVSMGTSASAPPYLAVVAALGTVLGGQAWLAVDVLLLGCVPLAGMTAYLATRWIVTAVPARVLLAASYALLPVAVGAVAAGRLGTAVAFILLPLIAVSAGRTLTAAPRQARRAAWATGLLIGLAAAFAPLTWALGALLAAAAVGLRRWLAAVDPLNAAIVAVTPFFVLFPWSLHLLASPSAFLSEAGLSAPGLTTHGLGATALLALSPGGPGVPPAWVTAGFAFALVALLLPARRPAVVIGGWAAALTGLLAAVVLSRVTVTPPAGGQPAAGWPGVATALAGLGLLVASAPAAEWLATIIQNGSGTLPSATSASGRGQRSRRLLASAALAGAAAAPLFVAAYWVTDGVRGPVGKVSAPLLPAFISASSTSGAEYRTLILRPDGGGLDYQVVRQGDPSLGEPELGTPAAAQAVLSRQVAALGARDGADAGDPGLVLGSFGIKWVLLPGPVDPVLASRLDASIGLVALNKGPSYDLWQVTGPAGRVRVVASSGATTVLSSATGGMTGAAAPASGGTLILAEPYGGWTATLNGRALKPVAAPVGGWAQGFVLPSGGGQLSITYNGLSRLLSLLLELVATLTVIVAALPGKRVDLAGETEAVPALREARAGASGRRTAGSRAAGSRADGSRADGAVRPRAGAGQRLASRALSGAGRLGAGRLGAGELGLGRKRRAGRALADEGPPESPALGDQSPARPDAQPAGLARAETATMTVRAERGHGRHRGISGDISADDAGGMADADRAASAGDAAGTGGFPAAPWETGEGWDSPVPALGAEPDQQPPAPRSSPPESMPWGALSWNMPGDSATGPGRQDDADWLQELLRRNGVGQQSPGPAPAAPESSRWATDSLDVRGSSAPDAGRGDDLGRQSGAPESAKPESRPWAAGPLDPPRPSADAERPDDSARRRTSNWKGALARLTGQQPALPESSKAEPAGDAARPFAAAERRDDADWLDELIRKNDVAQPPAAAEAPPPAPFGGTADALGTPNPAPDAGRHDDAGWPDALTRKDEPGRAGDPARRSGRHAAMPEPVSPASPPCAPSRPENPDLGSPAPKAPAPKAPVPETSMPESRPPWETEPQRAAGGSGPQPAVPAAGTQPRKPWESGPQAPVTTTGSPSGSPGDSPSAWRADARSAWETGPLPGAGTGPRTASRTGTQPTFTPGGPQPTFTPTGGQPTFTPSGLQPTFTPGGARPAAAPAGAAPVSPPGNPAADPGSLPAERPPWESGDWGNAPDWDAVAGDRDTISAAGEPGDPGQGSDGSQPGGAPGAEPGSAPGNRPAASPPAKVERHSHRGGRHGKPSRWRGPGGRSSGGGES